MDLEVLKQKYLWDGLDLDQYDVFSILPQDNMFAAIIMRDKEPRPYPWVAEFRGSGFYFQTYKQIMDYCKKRNWLNSNKD